MCKMTKFIKNTFGLNEVELQYVDQIVKEIKEEMIEWGEDLISEYELCDRFDEKLIKILNQKKAV